MATTRSQMPVGGWPRWRLLATLAGVALTALALLAGFVLVILAAFTPGAAEPPERPPTESASGELRRDLIAAAPMMKVPASAASTPNLTCTPRD